MRLGRRPDCIVEVEDDRFAGARQQPFVNRGPDQRCLAIDQDRIVRARRLHHARSAHEIAADQRRLRYEMSRLVEDFREPGRFKREQIDRNSMMALEMGRPLLEPVALTGCKPCSLAGECQHPDFTLGH